MSTATTSSSGRVRQIAILVSSVDAVVARQLLLHLPTEMAKQVRALAAQLGPIAPAERRAILAEFQKSASTPVAASHQTSSPLPAATAEHHSVVNAVFASNANGKEGNHLDDAFQTKLPESSIADAAGQGDELDEDVVPPAWTRLSTEALVRFVQTERVTVIAVVVSQLPPHKAVEVLKQLPRETNHAVLKRLSNLREIDPDAASAIDEHLIERLSDYQQKIESERLNTKRIGALISAAPPELRQEWSTLLSGEEVAAPVRGSTANTHAPFGNSSSGQRSGLMSAEAIQSNVHATIAELYGDAVITTADTPRATRATPAYPLAASLLPATSSQNAAENSPVVPTADASAVPEEVPDVIPFRTSASKPSLNEVDRVNLQAEFEQLLNLARPELANLLSVMDSQTVLLALAGATPEFMRRFTKMLHPSDATLLTQRLQTIGPIHLRDVDEAQRRLIDRAGLHSQTSHSRRAA
ncbi:MAG: FliG C-terminal domain-containing protein [Pirellulaceae bacterium]